MPDIEIYVETPSETPSVGVWVDVRKASDLSLVSSTQTGSDGKVVATLVEGSYLLVLREGSKIFNTNNTAITVGSDNDEVVLSDEGITVISPTPPEGMVNGTATLRYANGAPVVGATIMVTMHQPTLDGGALYLGAFPLVTGRDGSVTEAFLPGLVIAVTVEKTNIYREFEVPDTDFNLMSAALSVADPFTIQSPTFPIAPSHS